MLKLKIFLAALCSLCLSIFSHGQYCDSLVPTFNVDLSASPIMNWTSIPVQRNGNCCGTSAPDQCLEFVIELHPSAIAVNFEISSGAVPPGALFYQIDCGPVTPVGSPICLDGPGPHNLTFCKPGNNINEFTITSYSSPIIGPDITLNAACEGFIYANYYDETSISWTSVYPGVQGAYDGLLSCNSSCDTTYITAPLNAPPYIDYLVCGMDVGGCNPNPICDTIRVNFLPPVEVNISSLDSALCPGEFTTLTAAISGGTGPYSILWSTGHTANSIQGQAGQYFAEVIDASGCHIATDTLLVEAFPLPLVDAGSDQTVCDGVQVTLNGSGAVTYQWDQGVQDGIPFTPAVGTTTYTVIGTDANGCSNTDQMDVTVYNLPNVTAGPDVSVCDGDQVMLNGGGALNYQWDQGVQNGAPFTPVVGVTTYTVIGTDANGCSNSDQVNVAVNPLPNVNAGLDQAVCNGQTVTLTGSGAVNYQWDNGVIDGVPFVQTIGTTTYTVIGTDANGCQNTDQVDVTVHPLPNVNAGPDQAVCDGVQVTLNATGAVNYQWDQGVQNGVPFNAPIGTTTYTVIGTDVNGCINADQVNVTVYPLPNVDAGLNQFVCEGTQVMLIGSGALNYQWDQGVQNGLPFTPGLGMTTYTVTGIDLNGCQNTDIVSILVHPLPVVNAGLDVTVCEGEQVVLSGSGATAYQWDNGVQNGIPFTPPVGTMTYTVIGTDANGCSSNDQVDVTVNPIPLVDAGVDQTVCDGVQVTLSGSGAVTYQWSHGIQDGLPFTPSIGTTTYTVIGTSANGCFNSDQVDVTVNPIPLVDAGADQTVCDGIQVTLNGSGALNYQWDQGIQDGVAFTPTVGTTTYTVIGTDINGCSNSDQVDVTVNPLPVVGAGPDQTVCDEVLVTLNGSGAVTYIWDQGVQDGVPFYSPIGTTLYTVIGVDANGCQSSNQASVLVTILPPVSGGPDVSVCDGEQLTLAGQGAQSYQWSGGIQDGVPFTRPVGQYEFIVSGTDHMNCSSQDTVQLVVNPNPSVEAGEDIESCDGSDIVLTAQGSQNLYWNHGVINNAPFNQPVGTEVYTVTDSLATGCVASDSVRVTIHPNPNVSAIGADIC